MSDTTINGVESPAFANAVRGVTTASCAASSVDWCPRLILWFKWTQVVAERPAERSG